jgi:hypothetical protein
MSIPLKDIGSSGSLVGLANIIGMDGGKLSIEASPWYDEIRVRIRITGSREYNDGVDDFVETYDLDEQVTLSRVPIPSPDDSGGIPSPALFVPDQIEWDIDLQAGECYMLLYGTAEISSQPGNLRMPPDPRRAMVRVFPLVLLSYAGKIGEASINNGTPSDINDNIEIVDPVPRSSIDDGDPYKRFAADVLTWTVDAVLAGGTYRAEDNLPTVEADARDLRGKVFSHTRNVDPTGWDTSTVEIITEVEFMEP